MHLDPSYALPFTLALALLLAWLMIAPGWPDASSRSAEPAVANIAAAVTAGLIEPLYRRIGVAVENSMQDASRSAMRPGSPAAMMPNWC